MMARVGVALVVGPTGVTIRRVGEHAIACALVACAGVMAVVRSGTAALWRADALPVTARVAKGTRVVVGALHDADLGRCRAAGTGVADWVRALVGRAGFGFARAHSNLVAGVELRALVRVIASLTAENNGDAARVWLAVFIVALIASGAFHRGACLARPSLARVSSRALITVVTRGVVRLGRVGAFTSKWVVRPGVVALVERGADRGVGLRS